MREHQAHGGGEVSGSSFDAQYTKQGEVPYFGGISYSRTTPERIKDGSVPVVLASGFSHGPRSTKEKARALHAAGHEVVTPRHPRRGAFLPGETDYHNVLERKASGTIEVAQALGIEEFDLVGHSEGAIIATIAAKLLTQKDGDMSVRSLVLVGPAGFKPGKTYLQLGLRLGHEMLQTGFRMVSDSSLHQPVGGIAVDGLLHVARNPFRTALEARAIHDSSIGEDLERVAPYGVNVGVIALELDRLFPPKELFEVAEENRAIKYMAVVDGAMHDDMAMRPDAIMAALDKMLTELPAASPFDSRSFML